MTRKPASIAATILLALSCFHGWSAAHAAAGPLERIDPQLVADHFKHERFKGVGSKTGDNKTIPGCPWERTVPGRRIQNAPDSPPVQ